ncbi:MAG: hypothetical protein WCB51_04190 [Candidatus Dormiibacterota bacterium]
MTELAPLRTSLLGDASARAAAMIAEATADAAAIRAAADAEAARIINAARDEGLRAAEATARSERLSSSRAARALVLGARRDRETTARDRALQAALDFRGHRRYTRLLDALEAEARRRLGAGVEIERDPQQGGGVRATRASRSLDLTLPRLAAQAVEQALRQIDAPSLNAKEAVSSR